MRHFFTSCLLIFTTAQLALGHLPSSTDSLRVTSKPAVVVHGPRDSIILARSTVDRTVLSADDIHAKAPYQLQEVLSDVPGLYIRQYGGLGGLATVSVRGGSAAQSLVTLNGIRLNTIQTGSADLSVIPISMIKHIDVQRGARSAVGGSNAMNGSMDIRLAVPETGMRVQASAGSFDSWKGAWAGAVRSDALSVGASVEALGSAGSYAYNQPYDGELISINRQNGAVNSVSGLLLCEAPNASWLTLMMRKTSRGVPGAVVDDVITQGQAHFEESDVMGIVGTDVLNAGNQRLHLDMGLRYLDQHYTDPQATITGLQGIDARYLAREGNVSLSWVMTTSHTIQKASIHSGFADLRGTSLQAEVGNVVQRRQAGLGYELTWNAENVEATAAVRYDTYSGIGNALVADAGLAWLVSSYLTLRSNVGTGYRAPSFSELYLLNYGNVNLKPERNIVGTVGMYWQPYAWIVVDASAYTSAITDLIVSVPLSPVVTSAMNVGRATGYGIECSAVATLLQKALTLSWKYTLQDVRDRTGRAGLDDSQIVYTPVEMVHASAQWSHASVNGRIEWSYTSYRYAQPGGEATSIIAPYQLVNAVAGTTIKGKAVTMNLQLRVDNVFNQRYAVIRGFPMPGTMVRIATELVL